MRKLIIQILAFNYYFKVGDRLVSVSRLTVSLITCLFLSVVARLFLETSDLLFNIVYFSPIVFISLGCIYLYWSPVSWERDKNNLKFNQRYYLLGRLVEELHLLDYKDLYSIHKAVFKVEHGKLETNFRLKPITILIYYLVLLIQLIIK